MKAYEEISTEEFDERLIQKIEEELPISELLSIPGIPEILSEYFNNEILEEYEVDNCHWETYEDVTREFEFCILPEIVKAAWPEY